MTAPPTKVDIAAALATIDDYWNPRIAGAVNDTHIKLVKFAGRFDWHRHNSEDEMFLVITGTMRMGLRTGDIDVGPGAFIVIPHGTEHRPEAIGGECAVLLVEPATTLNTGDVVTEKTRRELKRL